MIEDLFKKNGKGGEVSNCTVVMKIKWKQRRVVKNRRGKIIGAVSKKPMDVPCPRCRKTICHAIHCGMKIYLCRTDSRGNERKQTPDCNPPS